MDELQRLCKRASGVQYFVEHHYGLFYILTNAPMPEGKWSGDDYYLVKCRFEDIESAKWQVMFGQLPKSPFRVFYSLCVYVYIGSSL